MAKGAGGNNSTGTLIIILSFLIIPVIAIGLAIGLSSNGSVGPSGALAAQPITAGPNSPVIDDLNQITRLSNSKEYLLKNSQLVSVQIQTIIQNIRNDPTVQSNPNKTKILVLLNTLTSELNQITGLANNPTEQSTATTNFMNNLAILNPLLNQGSGGSNGVPIYKQDDYKMIPYNSTYTSGKTIATSGCGIVAAAMVLSYYHKNNFPNISAFINSLAQYAISKNFRDPAGTSWGFFESIAANDKLNSSIILQGKPSSPIISWDKVSNYLKHGQLVIVSGDGSRPFTQDGHFVVLTGIAPNGNINVNDPAGGADRNNRSYPPDTIYNQYHFAIAIYDK